MVETAKRFLASLTDDQRAAAQFSFDDQERFFWHYIPADDIPKRYQRERKGLPLLRMTPMQKHLAAALLSAGLSQQGYIKATEIMSLEEVLRLIEGGAPGRRDPEKYFFSVFGDPSEKGRWGYRVEGHHVSLHFTVVDGKAVGNPSFFGSNPAVVPQGPMKGMRILGREEDKARALLTALTPDQRKTAIVDATAYPDILTAASRKAALEGQPSGLQVAKMTSAQRQLLTDLINEYIDNLPAEMAEQRTARVKSAGDRIWFAWAGGAEKGQKHYYRVQAPGFLIEYDNTQNDGNHIHSVWRDFNGDWGEDLLKEHYQTAPAAHGHDPAQH